MNGTHPGCGSSCARGPQAKGRGDRYTEKNGNQVGVSAGNLYSAAVFVEYRSAS